MAKSNFLLLSTEAEYKQYFIDNYCAVSPIYTWDKLPVEFYADMFEHAFYKRTQKSWKAKKNAVDIERCKRMAWIKEVLLDPSIVPRVGFDKAKDTYDNSRRVALVSQEKYVVVIRNTGKKWRFVTAYIIDNQDTYNKLMASPIWQK